MPYGTSGKSSRTAAGQAGTHSAASLPVILHSVAMPMAGWKSLCVAPTMPSGTTGKLRPTAAGQAGLLWAESSPAISTWVAMPMVAWRSSLVDLITPCGTTGRSHRAEPGPAGIPWVEFWSRICRRLPESVAAGLSKNRLWPKFSERRIFHPAFFLCPGRTAGHFFRAKHSPDHVSSMAHTL